MAITQVHTACIKDGTIVNADIDASAAIALSKLGTSGTAGSGNYLRGDGAWSAIDLSTKLNLTGGTLTGILTVNRVINATNSADPWLKGVNSSNTETSFIKPDGTGFFAGTVTANLFHGSGANLTNLHASNLATGTIAEARLSTATTQSAGNNSTKIATTAYVETAVSNLVDSAPGTLNTLNELAAALGDDANFSTTVTNSIATKLPLAGGTMTGHLLFGNGIAAKFGSSAPLQIEHTGSNSTITDSGTGKLILKSDNQIELVAASNASMIEAIVGGAVNLFHNGTWKAKTVSGGFTINGTCTATTFSGSGASLTNVNATTLDSIDSGSFLRSDTSATFSGNMLTLSHGGASYPLHISGSDDAKMLIAGASNPYFEFREGSTTKAFFQWHSQGYVKIQNAEDNSSLRIKDTLDFSTDDSTWSTVWHSGNDGSGSGLNADLLDGQQGSFYTNAGNINAGTVPTARLGSGSASSSTYLRGDSTWATVAAGVTINNQADNRIITSTNTSNSLYAEGSFTFDGTDVDVATTGSVGLPEGTTAQRGSNVNGKIRYNSTTKSIEGHADGTWGTILTMLGTSTNPYSSVAEAQANNQAEGLTYFKNSGGTAQQVYYDNSDGGWILVASNHVSESVLPSGTSRNNLAYTLHRNGTNGHQGTANPSKDYLIGNWYMTFSYSRCRGIGYGRNSTSTNYTWTNRGDWVSAQFAVTSRDTIVGVSSVTWTSSRGDNVHHDADYWSIDGIWSDYRNGNSISANSNQTTIGIVGVANSSGSPQYGCYYGHGNNEGNHEGWYDSGGGNMNSSGYTTWLR